MVAYGKGIGGSVPYVSGHTGISGIKYKYPDRFAIP